MRRGFYTPIRLATIPAAFLLATAIVLAQSAGSHQKDPSLLHIGRPSFGVTPTEVVPARRLIPQMHWGVRDSSGLQLGAHYDSNKRHIFCLIRNAGAHPVTMNAYQFGCPGYIKVYARIAGTTEWTQVSDGLCGHGVGPRAIDNVTVQPGQYLIGKNLEFGGGTEHRTITQIECSFSEPIGPRQIVNPDNRPMEFRVEHKLPNDGSHDVWQGTLSSAVLTVPANALPHPTQ